MLNYAIIGFGGLGKSHFRNTRELLKKAGDIKLVALCDVEKDAFETQTAINISSDETSLDLSPYNIYYDYKELLENEKLDFIISVVPTFLHEKIATDAMNKGIHVFSEKPMAISVEAAQRMIDVSKKNDVKLMVGQCLRFWPEYQYLKEMIELKKYGKVLNAHFKRLSATPKWSWQNWYLDESRSGGCALDMHVHDVDFINWAFGKPESVTSRAVNYDVKHDSITTFFDYKDLSVCAEAWWGLSSNYPFTAEYLVRFEKGTVELKDGKVTAYTDEGVENVVLEQSNAYVNEVMDFIDCIKNNSVSSVNPSEDSKISLEIALAEKLSADKKETIKL